VRLSAARKKGEKTMPQWIGLAELLAVFGGLLAFLGWQWWVTVKRIEARKAGKLPDA
jgi:hypothetical protein